MKKSNVILSGVGGQGILTIAAVISMAALNDALNIKQAEVHGMSQRGGAVQSHLRIADTHISSDLIPLGEADVILSVEPVESLRYLPYLKKGGSLVTNSKPFVNVSDYPDIEAVFDEIRRIPNHLIVNADQLAREIGSPRSSNIVMLGAASPFLCVNYGSLEKGIQQIFKNKGAEIVKVNLEALHIGREFAGE